MRKAHKRKEAIQEPVHPWKLTKPHCVHGCGVLISSLRMANCQVEHLRTRTTLLLFVSPCKPVTKVLLVREAKEVQD